MLSLSPSSGFVVYTGVETRCGMNREVRAKQKISRFDEEASRHMKTFLLLMIFYSVLILIVKGNLVSSLDVILDFIRWGEWKEVGSSIH